MSHLFKHGQLVVSEWVRVINRRIRAVVTMRRGVNCQLNKNDFSCRQNSPMSLSGWRILADRLFQSRGPAAAKLRSPSRVLVRGTQHDVTQCNAKICNHRLKLDNWCSRLELNHEWQWAWRAAVEYQARSTEYIVGVLSSCEREALAHLIFAPIGLT